ncbi:MAG: FAD-binding oxidoreductase [Actinobacteria bacterium]|nr:FAD-binding oxidoreductase [Actinomycetota bacterium]
MHTLSPDLSMLRGIDGITLPGDPGYDDARTAWNLAADQRPAAIATPRTVAATITAVRAAGSAGLRIAPQSTGHGALPLAARGLEDALLLRLDGLTGVEIDAERRIARVLGGTLWRDVIAAAAPYGLTALHGSAGDVAVAGYLLGGGLSFYARTHGLATHHVRAFEVVTSGGDLVRASADTHPGLFWGLRGGGGGFGAVVAMEIELLAIPDVQAGFLLWDIDAAPAVLSAWRDWTGAGDVTGREGAGRDRAVTTSLRLLRFPPLPELPPFLSGRSLVIVDGAILADDDRAAELLAPLRALEPEMDTFARIPSAGLLDVHIDPPAPTPSAGDHVMLGPLDDAALATLLGAAGPGATDAPMIVELCQLGGALAQAQDAALGRLEGDYALLAIDMVPAPALVGPAFARTGAVVAPMSAWRCGNPYLNFVERPIDTHEAYDAEVADRLRRVRAIYDPMRCFVSAHPVPAA